EPDVRAQRRGGAVPRRRDRRAGRLAQDGPARGAGRAVVARRANGVPGRSRPVRDAIPLRADCAHAAVRVPGERAPRRVVAVRRQRVRARDGHRPGEAVMRRLSGVITLVAAASLATPGAALADGAGSPQAIAARAEFLSSTPAPPGGAGAVCVIDSGVDTDTDLGPALVERGSVPPGGPVGDLGAR